jgi:hypothetical protein
MRTNADRTALNTANTVLFTFSEALTSAQIRTNYFLINLVMPLVVNPPEDTRSENRMHLRLCCVFNNCLQCGASCDVSIVQAVYKLLTSYRMQRFRVTVRMRITGRHRKDFNILMIDI